VPVGFGHVGEVTAERRHQRDKLFPKRRLVDRGDLALEYHDLAVDNRRLDGSTVVLMYLHNL
jgi:hypothetical protein